MLKKNKCENFEKEINEFVKKFNEFDNDSDRKPFYLQSIKDNNLLSFVIGHKYYSIRPSLYPQMNRTKQIKNFKFSDYPIYDFIQTEDITFKNNSLL
jgi:hypothetical protein